MARTRKTDTVIEKVDFLSTISSFPGCCVSCLPEGQLALLGYATAEEVQTIDVSRSMDVPQLEDMMSVILRLVTKRGRIYSMPEWRSPDNVALNGPIPVTAREMVASALGVPVESLTTFRQEWQSDVDANDCHWLCSFYCVTAEASLVRYALERHEASLVLEEESGADAEMIRTVYPRSVEIEPAEWEGEFDEALEMIRVENDVGVWYRTASLMEVRDLVHSEKRKLFSRHGWHRRLTEWVRTLQPEVSTLTQKLAFDSLMGMIDVPHPMIDVEQFIEDLSRFPVRAPEGRIPLSALCLNGAMLTKGTSLRSWNSSDAHRQPDVDHLPDIRYLHIT